MNHDYILLTVSLGPISPSKLVWSAVSKRGPISDYLFFLNWTTMYSIYACSKLVKCPCLKWICGGKQNISHSVWILYMCTQLISSIQVKNITHMHAIVQAFIYVCIQEKHSCKKQNNFTTLHCNRIYTCINLYVKFVSHETRCTQYL